MRVSQRESEDAVSLFPSDTFDYLLRRAAAFLTVLPVASSGVKSDAERCESTPIGETAGAVWHMLSDGGPASLASLIEAAGVTEKPVLHGRRVACPGKQNHNRAVQWRLRDSAEIRLISE